MTIFNDPMWCLINEFGYERILSEPEENRPLFWFQRDAIRYSTSIGRSINYGSSNFTLALGLSFMYGNRLVGAINVNGECRNFNYQNELAFGPTVSVTYRNSDISERLGLRFEYEKYGRNNSVTSLSILYTIN
ncbi:hypothetical protein ACFOUP_16480 [Belliella kenyensis]|uniref:Outer membrane protein beta-barrel family protein n=1 Tax=Belliella kenyensis TaxID=1472724 RepID=A0ABV8ENT7_9BACT|nr:hypothetical protein [Belliella kenyensis]MCH7403800.1 hypothetical protein [Belliella kenyensis]MDN3602416.1 hypothetical protein [Belliella kenyensis]